MTDEEIKALVEEFNRKVSLDPEIRSVMDKIRNQGADLDDTSRLCLRRSELMGQFMQSHLPDLAPGDRERLCTALLHDGYEVTNEVVPDALRAQDERLGLHLNPVRAPFPWERVQTVSHSLEDPGITEEQRSRRAGAPVANTSMSFHDDSVKENARIRAKLGFKCYLNRVAASGCCKWCTDIAGRYVYGDHPGDIFRRHDNCGCTVTFENGRQRQDVWSKQTWQASPAEVLRQAREPVRFSTSQAEDLQDQLMQGVHAIKGKKRGKFEPSVRMDTIIGGKPIEESFQKELSDEFDKFISIFGSMDNVRSVTAYPYQNDGIWGAYNDNSYELFLLGSGGEEGRALLSKTAKQMRKDGKWSTSSVYHTFRHELGHALQERLKRTDPNYSQKIQEIEKIQKTILDNLTNLEESDKIKSMKSTLSEYGICDEIDEFISECIAEYCDGKPRTTAKSVVDILLKGGEQNVG